MNTEAAVNGDMNVEDLHLLMAVAVMCGQRGLQTELLPVYEAWEKFYPEDALGPLGRGLFLIGKGETREGYNLVELAAIGSKTRADQAREVLATLQRDLHDLVHQG